MALYAALPIFLSVAAGRAIDRAGPLKPLLWSSLALAAGVGLPAALPGAPALYFAATLLGVAFMAFHIAVQSAVGALSEPEARTVNYSWLALGFSVSGFLGPTTAGLAIDFAGHRLTFALLALSAIVPAAVLAFAKPRFPPAHGGGASRGNVRQLLESADLRRVFLVTGMLAMAWDLFYFVMPIYGTSIGLSATTIGAILGSFALATFAVRLVLPWVARRLPAWRVVTATFCIAASAYALFPLFHTVALIAAVAFLLGLGLGASQPSLISLIQSATPAGRLGEALGVRTTVMNVSHTFLPLLFGGVGSALGIGPVFWAMAAILGAGGVLAGRHRTQPAGP